MQVEPRKTVNVEESYPPVGDNFVTNAIPENNGTAVADATIAAGQTSEIRTITAELGMPSTSSVSVVFPLSEVLQRLLGVQESELSPTSASLWTKLCSLIDTGEIIWPQNKERGGITGGVAVVKCSEDAVVKIVPKFEDFTEFTTMQYLGRHSPDIPIPTPLGVLMAEKTAYIFMSYVPGPTLDSVWSQLSTLQKGSIANELNEILLKLRDLKMPDDSLLGGIGGEGCKDTRRHTRISQKPIKSVSEFEDFIFSNPIFGSSVYIKLIRRMSQSHAPMIVFSHGDLRPANIVVKADQQGNYTIRGILDWERAGFYPDYWESVKATNTMAPQDEDDWYLHLPICASPTSYPLHWLVDREWDIHVA